MIERKRSADKDSILDRSFHFDIEDTPQDTSRPPEFAFLPESPFRQDSDFPFLSRNMSDNFPLNQQEIPNLPIKFDDLRPGLGLEPLRLSILPQTASPASPKIKSPEHSKKKITPFGKRDP